MLSTALQNSPFVSQLLDELSRLICSESMLQSFVDDFFVLSLHVYTGRKVALRSVEGGHVLRIANKFCAYVDFPHDRVALSTRGTDTSSIANASSSTNPEVVVSLPGIFEQLLRTPQMSQLLMSRMHQLSFCAAPLCSPGAVGELLETSFDYALDFTGR